MTCTNGALQLARCFKCTKHADAVLLQTDPRDELPHAPRASWTLSVTNYMAKFVDRSNVDHCNYCQLSSADDGPVYYSERLALSSELDNKLR